VIYGNYYAAVGVEEIGYGWDLGPVHRSLRVWWYFDIMVTVTMNESYFVSCI
jgi:hypothetical protein